MRTDDKQIRELVERWARAVHAGDLDAVVADHAEDIVMFDVPPPYEGVRGLDAYRRTWPGFFDWQAQGATFDLVELEVTAGEDVGYAFALLRCGMPGAYDPKVLLRLTLGLRKEDGRWVVAHEHHSFPLADSEAGEREVRERFTRWSEQTAAGDLEGMMAAIADDVVAYEQQGPLRYEGVDELREVCRTGLEAAAGATVTWDIPDLEVLVRDDLAVTWGLDRIRVGGNEPVMSRGTRVFRRRGGGWEMVHEHLSLPQES
ncbi:nuclear transport factor 2 family protein [Nonomuraea sp. MCN248]|uniref:Nuclear transport factor 2 family protein n=1 Tax=Nonomuraea corallina TaxID=2989783 RepID=A0ABT4SNL4_9ACTN|nr:nuclear transport factor 2 family protein [Nonomuraea corallina]MDA0638665.1 nuclear transport factor 2 family protein [Nonomuraea corallina]